MKTPLTVSTVLEKNKISGEKPFHVMMEIDVISDVGEYVETVRIVNGPEDLVYRGNTFISMPFKMDVKHESGTQASFNVSMADYTKAIIEKMNQHGGGIGFQVRLIVISSETLEANGTPDVLEYFEIMSANASEYMVSFNIGVENFLTKLVPGRAQRRDFCSWTFKEENCGYSGSESFCDRTLNGTKGCRVKGNERRFGGFPSIIASDRRNA